MRGLSEECVLIHWKLMNHKLDLFPTRKLGQRRIIYLDVLFIINADIASFIILQWL